MSDHQHRRDHSRQMSPPPRQTAVHLASFQRSFLAPRPSASSVSVQSEAAEILRIDTQGHSGSSSDRESHLDPRFNGYQAARDRSISEPMPSQRHPFAAQPPAPASEPWEAPSRSRGLGVDYSASPPPVTALPEIPHTSRADGAKWGDSQRGDGRHRQPPNWHQSREFSSVDSAQGGGGEFPRSPSPSPRGEGKDDGHGEAAQSSDEDSPPKSEVVELGAASPALRAHSHNLPHLPPLVEGSKEPTSTANWTGVVEELEFAISKIVGKHVMEELLKDKSAFHRFRDFIARQPDQNSRVLDFYNDLSVLSSLATQVRLASESIKDVYLVDSPTRVPLPISIRGPVLDSLHRSSEVGIGLLDPQAELLSSLFTASFEPYITEKLIEHIVKRLEKWDLGHQERDGLADAFVLTNPRLRDDPIVLASEGFASLTGYSIAEIIGRNCRFLQGPSTAPSSVLNVREALRRGEGHTSLLLNYRCDGSPFLNLLALIPLKDPSGCVKYFLGGQIDVTSSLSSLASPFEAMGSSHPSSQPKFSSAVRKRQEEIISSTKKHGGVIADGRNAAKTQQEVDGADSDTLHVKMRHEEAEGVGRPSGATEGKGKQREGSGHGSSSGSGGNEKSFFGDMSRKLKKVASSGGGARAGDQVGMTLEEQAKMGGGAPLLSQIREFETTYSRVILLRRSSREILFITPELLTYTNLSAESSSSLTGVDFVKVLTSPHDGKGGEDSDRGHRIRRNVRSAISAGHSFATPVGLKPGAATRSSRKVFGLSNSGDGDVVRECTLHLTPLVDRDGMVEAFVAVFG